MLEAMLPRTALGGLVGPEKAFPLRMAFCFVPNGKNMADWTPKEVGALALSPSLEPLKAVKDDLLVLTGLAHQKAFANGDGPGDHARSMATFLTARQARKTEGSDIRIGISVDQVAAQKVGEATRFASLEIGCEGGKNSGGCDSGYSCAYSSNLAWRSESTPMSKETDPRAVFDRFFARPAPGDEAQQRRDRYKQSILDFVAEDAKQLQGKLGSNDQHKLDEYLTGVREIEHRILKAPATAEVGDMKMDRPSGIPKSYEDHLKLMGDLMVLAFQGDLTRIATFVFANDGSNRSYKDIGVGDGHHDLSHHQGNKEKLEKIAQINRFHVTQYAYLLEKLKAVKEGDGTLLDNCMIVYGSGISDGNAHNHDELPVLLAGKGRGTLKTGRHVHYKKGTPMANLFLAMLDRMDTTVESFGDSNGHLTDLEG
jgi:hypothetical protein